MPDEEDVAHQWVRRALRAEMAKRDLSYADLVKSLAFMDVLEDERVLRNKIARGTFSAAFFVQCLAAMGVKTLPIDLFDQVMATREKPRTAYSPSGGEPGKET